MLASCSLLTFILRPALILEIKLNILSKYQRMAESNTPQEPAKPPAAGSGHRTHQSDYGYEFYPERLKYKTEGFWERLSEGRASADTVKCVSNVYYCYKKSESPKMMIKIIVILSFNIKKRMQILIASALYLWEIFETRSCSMLRLSAPPQSLLKVLMQSNTQAIIH